MTRKMMANIMIVLTVAVSIAAGIVCYMAIERANYLIAVIMGIVIIGQIINFVLWRKKGR